MGRLQQDEVGPDHQVQGVKQCQVRGGATPLPPLLPGQFYCEHLTPSNYSSVSKLILR